MGVKVDMSKADDRVDWNILDAMLCSLGFSVHFCKLIKKCISSAHYTLLINGRPAGSFKPQKGLRQVDPISLYLFVIYAELLSRILHRAEDLKIIAGLRVGRESLSLTHLMCANDLLFVQPTKHQVRALKECIEIYGSWSCQSLSRQVIYLFL